MQEFWEATHIRGQQTVAVWNAFAPAFTVSTVTRAAHAADVALLLTHVNDRDVQQDAFDDADAQARQNRAFIRDVTVRGPELIDANLDEGDLLKGEVKNVTAVEGRTEEGNLERARKLISLWTRVNAARAALVPPLPELKLGSITVAQLQAAVTNHPTLSQAVKDQDAGLSAKKSQLRQTEARVDKNNKRWYAAWAVNFVPGTPEHDALSQVDTEPGTNPPSALEIAAVVANGLNADLTYVAGGGRHATSLRLLYKVNGVDADFAHPTSAILAGQTAGPFAAGQTVDFKTVAENSVGTTESAVKSVTF